MHIVFGLLFGIGFALLLLYSWLMGQWFARVLMFLIFGSIGFAIGCMPLYGSNAGLGLILIPCGVWVGWLLASIPIYIQRWKDRQEIDASMADLALDRQDSSWRWRH
jgi:hypothetical protein